MRAIVSHPYSSERAIELRDIEEPEVGDDHVLVRVRAAAANTYDLELPSVLWPVARLGVRLRGPKVHIPGWELAGQVEAVGKNVKQFQPGDEAFGWCKGALAEFVCAREGTLAPKPASLSFEQAAVVPMSALTALQGLRDRGEIQPGQRALIIGASGGVGTFAVQIAKAYGAEVTGVCSARNVEMVRSIGADYVVDYTQEDFTRSEHRFDLILDMVGNRSLSDLRDTLAPEGTLVMVGSAGLPQSGGLWIKGLYRWLHAMVLSLRGRQRLRAMLQTRSVDDLMVLKELIEDGKITPVISGCHPLSEAPEAIKLVDSGHAQGKVAITVQGATASDPESGASDG